MCDMREELNEGVINHMFMFKGEVNTQLFSVFKFLQMFYFITVQATDCLYSFYSFKNIYQLLVKKHVCLI